MIHFYITPSLLFILTLLIAGDIAAQNINTMSDSAFVVYRDKANAHLEKTLYYDRLQYKYAKEFYQYYQANPETKAGQEALKDAIVMWINIKEANKIFEALNSIDYSSEAWYEILEILRMSSVHGGKWNDDYIELLNRLEQDVTEPKTRSAILQSLILKYSFDTEKEKIKELYREIITLNANEHHVQQARNFLHEFERLAIGNPAPLFEASTTTGKFFSLADQKGTLILLNFWSPFVYSGDNIISSLNNMSNHYSEEDLVVIGVPTIDNAKKIRDFIIQHGISWTQLELTANEIKKLKELYNAHYMRNIVIDKKGAIASKNLWGNDMVSHVDSLLSKE
ncbi:MAG: redoxin domain-containing protein [Balneolaceae bacterium]|nr:redoxin domain-containing protein [Balneolaceae bacterium]